MSEARYPLDVVFELVDLGAGMVAARHRREHPEATESEVQAAVDAGWVIGPWPPMAMPRAGR